MVKVTSRRRSLGSLGVVLVGLEGCGLVVGLGDPKGLGDPAEGGVSMNQETPQVQATRVAVGTSHACAVVNLGEGNPENGSVRCWGSNKSGQLGTDPAALPFTDRPLEVSGFPTDFTGASELALSVGDSCAISVDGYLFCWGGVPDEVGSGIHRQYPVPAYQPSVIELDTTAMQPVTSAALDASGGCIIANQVLVCWGALAPYSGRDGGVDGGAAISDPGFALVAVGGANACAVASDDGANDIECWGNDTYGQSGGGVGGSLPDPSPIGLSGDVRQLAAGASFACALLGDGSVSCWGDNDRGQLGPDGPAGSTATPVPIPFPGGLKALALAVGDQHACAVVDDSTSTFQNVDCWGDNSTGQLGVGPSGPTQSATALEVQRLSDGGTEALPHIERIAAGGGTTCVVRSTDALVSCWGANEYGQAGQPASARVDYATPVQW
jgi:alpha-tubulin suppressor-like RCC1 family protein